MNRLAAAVLWRRERRIDLTGLGAGAYRIAYRQARVGDDCFFVPGFAAHRPASRAILGGRLFEPKTHEMVERIMRARPGSMVHAGTFFGDMLPGFARACPGTVHAFEPVLENYVLARATVEANDLPNVALLHAALGASGGIARIETQGPGGHHGGASAIAPAGQRCTVLAIDALALAGLTLVQLDVEGHELEVLRGAKATLKAARPVVMVEDGGDRCPAFLTELGYSRAGEIPGQKVWAPDELLAEVAALVP